MDKKRLRQVPSLLVNHTIVQHSWTFCQQPESFADSVFRVVCFKEIKVNVHMQSTIIPKYAFGQNEVDCIIRYMRIFVKCTFLNNKLQRR